MGDAEARTLVVVLAKTLAEKEAYIFGDAPGNVQADALLDTLANRQEGVEGETLGESLCDDKTYTQLVVLID